MRFNFVLFYLLFNYCAYSNEYPALVIKESDTSEVIVVFSKSSYRSGNLKSGVAKIHRGITYINGYGKKETILPHEADKVIIYLKEDTIVFVSRGVSDTANDKFSNGWFYELVVDGSAKLLCEYGMSSAGLAMRYQTHYFALEDGAIKQIIEWEDGSKTYLTPWTNYTKENLAKIFESCPKLKYKILSKEFKLRDMTEIVKYYNSNCNSLSIKEQQSTEE